MYSDIHKMKFVDYYKKLKEKYINHILIIQRGNFCPMSTIAKFYKKIK